MPAAACLVCDSPITAEENVELGEIVGCTSCGQEHEVTLVADAELIVQLAPELEEDWGE